MRVTSANIDERTEVAGLLQTVQAVTEGSVNVAFADQGYQGEKPAEAAAAQGVDLIVIKLPEAKDGFVLLPKRWIVQRSFAWTTGFAVWSETMNATPPPSLDGTSSPLFVSCSGEPLYWQQVHNSV